MAKFAKSYMSAATILDAVPVCPVSRHGASAGVAEGPPVLASERSGSESVSRSERTSSSSSCIESTIVPISLASIEIKPLVGQPSQTQSPNQAQGWLNKGILHSVGVCLGVLVWRDYFAPKRDGTSVDMSNRAQKLEFVSKIRID